MFDPEKISINNFDYNLPLEKIAIYPSEKRDSSKLLVYNKGAIERRDFKSLPEYLDSNDLLIFNNTRVINARLVFAKNTGSRIEIFCLEPYVPSDFTSSLAQKSSCKWKCMVGNLKKWKYGELEKKYRFQEKEYCLRAKIIDNLGSSQVVEFKWDSDECFEEIIKKNGLVPLPPYIKRDTEPGDSEKYQTIYSKPPGSVAAPTAGLHFSNDVIRDLENRGIKMAELTLHVGAGTFQPVKSEIVARHEMHSEHFFINRKTLDLLYKNPYNIVSVGTTSLRAMESLYWFGVKLLQGKKSKELLSIGQWDGYNNVVNFEPEKSFETILEYFEKNNLDKIELTTRILIAPDYNFRVVKKLITNFHLPKSTLLLLVSAFIGEDWRKVYDFALNNDFRFLSYGDSSILIPK